jgi:hypothetical protein
MNGISFGISTTIDGRAHLENVVKSIYELNIPKDSFEIIVVGGAPISGPNLTYLEFDETIKPGWTTRKKNLANQIAKFPNLINSHDYYLYESDFYSGFLKFNAEFPHWDICMAKMINPDGTRYRDWVIWNDPNYGRPWICREPWCGNGLLVEGTACIPSYQYKKTQYLYISGGWQMARKHVMEEVPWDESIMWGQGEDAAWSRQALQLYPNKYNYLMNTYSTLKLDKYKDIVVALREDITE